MAGIVTENYDELCRLCASKVNLLIGVNIFEGEGSAREIDKKISSCLPIQVHEADRLPKMICSECVYKLELFFSFREKSIETETLLIELVKKLNNNTETVLEKVKEPKLIPEQRNMDIVSIDEQQMQIVQDSQELLEHQTMELQHELTDRDNLIVNQQIIINSHSITIHNDELDNIEITPHELNSPSISHENLNHQQLNLHHESSMAELVQQNMEISETQLNIQNLELIQQPSLISGHYEINEKSLENGQDCMEGSVLTLKDQRVMVSVKVEQDIKTEVHTELDLVKTAYSDGSDTEESSDADFDPILDTSRGENSKIDRVSSEVNTQLYENEKGRVLNSTEVIIAAAESEGFEPFYCNICGKTVNNREEYLYHYGEHVNKCFTCEIVFTSVEAFKTHRNQNHPKRPLERHSKSRARLKDKTSDQMDDSFFKEESSEDDHSSARENSSGFMHDEEDDPEDDSGNKNGKRKRWEPKVCKECGKSYKTNYKLAEHMRKHTGEQPFKCSMCDKAFRSKIGLAQHEAKHTGQFDFSCPTCGKGFQCKSYLIVHQRVHSDVKPYPCTTCGRDFKTKQSLLDHMNRHLGVKPFMCDICGRGFITKGLCKSHQKVHSGTDNRQYPCTVCKKLFVSKSYLATHLRIHTGEKPFMCEVCGKGFLTRVDLRIHSTMHTGEKSFVCEMCGKAFARRDALRCHRRSHTGERPYRCDICGQTFTQFSPMAIHKRLHTGERPYSCEVCNKTFVSRSTMMSHRKKHVP